MLTWRQEVHTAATIIDVIITMILGQMSFKTSEVYDLSVYFIGSHIEETGKPWLCCIDIEWTQSSGEHIVVVEFKVLYGLVYVLYNFYMHFMGQMVPRLQSQWNV